MNVSRITRKSEISAVLKLFKQEFGKNPQFGEWAGKPGYLRAIGQDMIAALSSGKLESFVIKQKRKILGYFGTYSSPANARYPSMAGIEIVLDRSIQGKGIAKICYRMMFEHLSKTRIKLVKGGTSQPAVLALAKAFKRQPFAYLMKFNSKYFSSNHFNQ